MSEPIESSRFPEVGWRVLAYTEATHFRTGSLAEGVALAEAICEVACTASRQPEIDLRSKGVTVRVQRAVVVDPCRSEGNEVDVASWPDMD